MSVDETLRELIHLTPHLDPQRVEVGWGVVADVRVGEVDVAMPGEANRLTLTMILEGAPDPVADDRVVVVRVASGSWIIAGRIVSVA